MSQGTADWSWKGPSRGKKEGESGGGKRIRMMPLAVSCGAVKMVRAASQVKGGGKRT